MSDAKKQKSSDTNEEFAENLQTSASNHLDYSITVEVQAHSANGAHVEGLTKYKKLYDSSLKDTNKFWQEHAKKTLHWDQPFHCVTTGSFKDGDVQWFSNGKLNASVQCLDRHVWDEDKADLPALIWEGDEPGTTKTYTFREALRETCKIANALKGFGVKKGDSITIYLPMIPEVVFTMLACARLGAPHSVVFAGFSAEALRDRIIDVQSKYVFVSDEGMRGGRPIALKKILDDALSDPRCGFVEKVFMFKRTGNPVNFHAGRDVWMGDECAKQAPYCPAESVDSEHPMFYLYTSGSTGKPKGLMHTTAGYMLYASMTHKYVFDVRPGDVYACVADCGWITGKFFTTFFALSQILQLC
jgi:acetyl-CoA synthetase